MAAPFRASDAVRWTQGALVRGTLLHPAAVATGIVALIAIGRMRGAGALRLMSRGLLLFAAGRRLLRLVKKL